MKLAYGKWFIQVYKIGVTSLNGIYDFEHVDDLTPTKHVFFQLGYMPESAAHIKFWEIG